MTPQIVYKKKDGTTKYYASYRSAWNRAAKMNQTAVGGQWYFEGDLNGWYIFWEAESTCEPPAEWLGHDQSDLATRPKKFAKMFDKNIGQA